MVIENDDFQFFRALYLQKLENLHILNNFTYLFKQVWSYDKERWLFSYRLRLGSCGRSGLIHGPIWKQPGDNWQCTFDDMHVLIACMCVRLTEMLEYTRDTWRQ